MSSRETDNTTPKHRIVVASRNPVKLNAALQACMCMFPDVSYEIEGVSVPSGVPDQPLSDEETLQGALNRAQNAQSLETDADYWFGIEGGVEPHGDTFQSFAWVAVIGRSGRVGKARTAMLYLPQEVAKLVREGMELGHADDVVFGKENSKQHSGLVGLLTDDVIDRSSYYRQAAILALVPFKNTNLTF